MKRKRIMALKRTLLFGCLTAEEVADIAQRAVDFHSQTPSLEQLCSVRLGSWDAARFTSL